MFNKYQLEKLDKMQAQKYFWERFYKDGNSGCLKDRLYVLFKNNDKVKDVTIVGEFIDDFDFELNIRFDYREQIFNIVYNIKKSNENNNIYINMGLGFKGFIPLKFLTMYDFDMTVVKFYRAIIEICDTLIGMKKYGLDNSRPALES